MPKTVSITTVSLPKSMTATLKTMSRAEGRTISELIREALRHYERLHRRRTHSTADWNTLRARLARVSQVGRATDLAAYIIQDRQAH